MAGRADLADLQDALEGLRRLPAVEDRPEFREARARVETFERGVLDARRALDTAERALAAAEDAAGEALGDGRAPDEFQLPRARRRLEDAQSGVRVAVRALDRAQAHLAEVSPAALREAEAAIRAAQLAAVRELDARLIKASQVNGLLLSMELEAARILGGLASRSDFRAMRSPIFCGRGGRCAYRFWRAALAAIGVKFSGPELVQVEPDSGTASLEWPTGLTMKNAEAMRFAHSRRDGDIRDHVGDGPERVEGTATRGWNRLRPRRARRMS